MHEINNRFDQKNIIKLIITITVAIIAVTGIINLTNRHKKVDNPNKENNNSINNKVIYQQMELLFTNSVRLYTSEHSNADSVITSEVLISAGFLSKDTFIDPADQTSCRGYSIINNDDINTFIKCSNYETTGYNSKYLYPQDK